MFAEYSWKIWIFSVDTSRTLLRNQPNTNHTVFQLDFFLQTTLYLHMIYQPKYIRCPVLAAAKSLFSQPKIDRKYSFWHSAADEFENSFSKTFNTRFRSRRSDHGKRYFQKLGLVEVFCDFFFRVNFTRACGSVLNDKRPSLENSFWHGKVFWMSLSVSTLWDLEQ